jgi:glutathione S-transferase
VRSLIPLFTTREHGIVFDSPEIIHYLAFKGGPEVHLINERFQAPGSY